MDSKLSSEAVSTAACRWSPGKGAHAETKRRGAHTATHRTTQTQTGGGCGGLMGAQDETDKILSVR